MSDYRDYLNDPDIVNEPMPMREIHAIRLMIQDETSEMSQNEQVRRINSNARKVLAEHGINARSPHSNIKSATG
jgi:trimethylamine:corrinoid methyltransferase-like protein